MHVTTMPATTKDHSPKLGAPDEGPGRVVGAEVVDGGITAGRPED